MAEDGPGDDRRADRRGEQPERDRGQPVPEGQVRPVVHVEGGEHGHVGDAHAGDVAGVARPAAAPVLVADRGGGERGRADDEQVVVLPPPEGGQAGGGAEDDADGQAEPAAGQDVQPAALACQCRGRAGDHGGESGEHVDREEGQEHRSGRAHLVAEYPRCIRHGPISCGSSSISSGATYRPSVGDVCAGGKT